jgi:hypothetical protein
LFDEFVPAEHFFRQSAQKIGGGAIVFTNFFRWQAGSQDNVSAFEERVACRLDKPASSRAIAACEIGQPQRRWII